MCSSLSHGSFSLERAARAGGAGKAEPAGALTLGPAPDDSQNRGQVRVSQGWEARSVLARCHGGGRPDLA